MTISSKVLTYFSMLFFLEVALVLQSVGNELNFDTTVRLIRKFLGLFAALQGLEEGSTQDINQVPLSTLPYKKASRHHAWKRIKPLHIHTSYSNRPSIRLYKVKSVLESTEIILN